MDIVFTLAQCPYVDVNWQDKEGNTALIIAAQAGHITITNYLLNYFPGLDIERRNVHGFTPLMKAAMQGRTECVRALLLAGADIRATDPGRQFTPLQWAVFTARHDTTFLIHKLLAKPCPEQFSDKYRPEWPRLKELVAKAKEPRTCLEKICETIRSTLTFNLPRDPEEEGLMDHMVRMTTSICSPFVAIGCRTVCPDSPPCVGKRRLAVQEILNQQKAQDIKAQGKDNTNEYQKKFQNSQVVLLTKMKDRRASLQPVNLDPSQMSVVSTRRSSLLPLNMMRRSSVRPGLVMPKVRVIKAPTPTYQPERIRRRSSTQESYFLDIPKWRYKELKEERKKAEEEEEKKKAEEAEKQRAAKLAGNQKSL
ncbi:ankyrin repeat domain-containing protein 33B [Callorhinchus milii]|uniref:ankyrin repeat domain-containing protein 33B n=1 Tax=Callorhinchus milii TaxID=7868 RepID=UPI001C3F5255|nr:ankyrin repeat domain-containing protein 33B [Callorhinchus milii]